jgi:hypothetical protein
MLNIVFLPSPLSQRHIGCDLGSILNAAGAIKPSDGGACRSDHLDLLIILRVQGVERDGDTPNADGGRKPIDADAASAMITPP